MIMKYDKMVAITQAESQRKMEIARKAIEDMLSNGSKYDCWRKRRSQL